jgi:glycosyltransferase involved in cell wall biosynthesis
MMKKVLFHSYHFPPIGGSGAQRPLKMARHLLGLGYQSIVVTRGGEERADRWAPIDQTLAAEIPDGLEVWRVPVAQEPAPTARLRPLAERWLGVRDGWTAWWIEESVRLGLRAGPEVDLIYVWMQPYASAEAGTRLSRALGKPWVADLGDPWALDEMMVYPSVAHLHLERRRMRRLLGTASAIVMSTDEAVERLRQAFPEFCDRPVLAIPNGFDSADFKDAVPDRDDGKFRIVHSGYLHTELGEQHRRRRFLRRALGGAVAEVDILTRSHVFLVEAINEVLARNPEVAEILELHLAGVLNESDRRIARQCPVVKVHDYLTHRESIALMRGAQLLFLPMQKLPSGTRATVVPGKTYEYLASGTPVLAALPDGDARDILAAAGNARIVRPDDVSGLAREITDALERFRAGDVPAQPHPSVVERFEYRTLAGELAGVFDSVLAADRVLAA